MGTQWELSIDGYSKKMVDIKNLVYFGDKNCMKITPHIERNGSIGKSIPI
jgi:hypothetical protein